MKVCWPPQSSPLTCSVWVARCPPRCSGCPSLCGQLLSASSGSCRGGPEAHGPMLGGPTKDRSSSWSSASSSVPRRLVAAQARLVPAPAPQIWFVAGIVAAWAGTLLRLWPVRTLGAFFTVDGPGFDVYSYFRDAFFDSVLPARAGRTLEVAQLGDGEPKLFTRGWPHTSRRHHAGRLSPVEEHRGRDQPPSLPSSAGSDGGRSGSVADA
jgi:hypothetical protein